MLNSGFVLFLLGPLAFAALFMMLWWKKIGLRKSLLYCTLLAYLLAVLTVTFFPVPIDPDFILQRRSEWELPGYNAIPFLSIFQFSERDSLTIFMRQVGGNILLTLPLGFFLPLLSQRYRFFQRVFFFGLFFSLGIESLQFLFSSWYGFAYKITDVDDILLNLTGTAIGFGCYRTMQSQLVRWAS